MYLDPSFGGMLLQVIVVIVAVGGALVYSFRRKLRELFSGKKGNDAAAKNENAVQGGDDMIDTLADEDKR